MEKTPVTNQCKLRYDLSIALSTAPDNKMPENAAFRVDAEKIRLRIRRDRKKSGIYQNPTRFWDSTALRLLPVTKPQAAEPLARLVVEDNELRMPLVRKKAAAQSKR